MKRNLLAIAALAVVGAVFLVAVGVWLYAPTMPLSSLPSVPTFLPRFRF